jgi:hypothetical protein
VPPHIARSLAYAHTSSARKVCCWEKGSKKVVSVTVLFLVTTKVIYKRKTKKKKGAGRGKKGTIMHKSLKKKERKKESIEKGKRVPHPNAIADGNAKK